MKFEILLNLDLPTDDVHAARSHIVELVFSGARANLGEIIKMVEDRTGGYAFGLKQKLTEMEDMMNKMIVRKAGDGFFDLMRTKNNDVDGS